MNEGEKLRALLDRFIANKKLASYAQFAEMCGVSGGAVNKWFAEDVIGDRAWRNTVRPGLKKLGANPSEIHPEPVAEMKREKLDRDLMVNVKEAGFTLGQLEVLRRIIQDGDVTLSQEFILNWIDAKLSSK